MIFSINATVKYWNVNRVRTSQLPTFLIEAASADEADSKARDIVGDSRNDGDSFSISAEQV